MYNFLTTDYNVPCAVNNTQGWHKVSGQILSRSKHASKASPVKSWDELSMEVVLTVVGAFLGQLQHVVRVPGDHVE